MGKGRLPQDIKNVPVKISKAVKLREFITKGGNKEKLAGICLSELSQLFMCFKRHSFNETACASEISAFQNCYNGHVTKIKEGEENTRQNKMSTENIEKLLKRFPDI